MNPVIKHLLDIYGNAKRLAKQRGETRFVSNFEDKTGFERGIIHRWENGHNGANLATVCAVANALGYRLVLEKIGEATDHD